jgi:lysophospholipid acyltransferase (LPLAT)-like uncharacterized protein
LQHKTKEPLVNPSSNACYNPFVVAHSTVAQASPPSEQHAFTVGQRFALFLIAWTGYLALRLIGPTLRWKVEIEPGGPQHNCSEPAILVFWHRCVFPATWRRRNQGIAVMTSNSFDGEYIARIIEKFGYVAVRGSSSRGAVRALLGMHTTLKQGRSAGFTIDGPRGPRYIAKPGPVWLARNTGVPICCFHIAVEKAWVLNSWDRFIIPKPFSRVVERIGPLIQVPPGSSSLEPYRAEMQATLDRLREAAERQMLDETGRNA